MARASLRASTLAVLIASERKRSDPASLTEDRHKRMMARFKALERSRQQDDAAPKESPIRAQSATPASNRERRSSYVLSHRAGRRVAPSGTRLASIAPRPSSSPAKAQRASERPHRGGAELAVTISHLNHLKEDIELWMRGAAADAAVVGLQRAGEGGGKLEMAARAPLAPIRAPLQRELGEPPAPLLVEDAVADAVAARLAASRSISRTASFSETAAQRAAVDGIMQQVRRSEASRRRVASREGLDYTVPALG